MKLYTEEQVMEAIKMTRDGVSGDDIINSLNFVKPTIEISGDGAYTDQHKIGDQIITGPTVYVKWVDATIVKPINELNTN